LYLTLHECYQRLTHSEPIIFIRIRDLNFLLTMQMGLSLFYKKINVHLKYLVIFFLVLFSSTGFATDIALGVEDDFQPFEYVDSAGVATGFNIDIAKAVGELNDWDIQVDVLAWSEMITLLDDKKLDLIGMYYTPERAKKYELSNPFRILSYVVFRNKNATEINELTQKTKALVAVQKASFGYETLIQEFDSKQLLVSDSELGVLKNLNDGKASYALATFQTSEWLITKHQLTNIEATNVQPISFGYVFASHDEEIIEQVNESISVLKHSGEYALISQNWLEFSWQKYQTITHNVIILSTVIVVIFSFSLVIVKRKLRSATHTIKTSFEQKLQIEQEFNALSIHHQWIADISELGQWQFDITEKTFHFNGSFANKFQNFNTNEPVSLSQLNTLLTPINQQKFKRFLTSAIQGAAQTLDCVIEIMGNEDEHFLFRGTQPNNSLNVYGVIMDVGKSVIIKREFDHQQRTLNILKSTISGAVYRLVLEKHLSIDYFSDNGWKLLGLEKGQEVQKNLTNYIASDEIVMVRQKLKESLSSQEPFSFHHKIIAKNKQSMVFNQGTVWQDKESKIIYIEGFLLDESEQVTWAKQLKENLSTDLPTKTPNRIALLEALNELKNNPQDESITLILIDIDGFFQINENYGNDVGDKIIVEFVNRLNKIPLLVNNIFRIGGDDFALFLQNISVDDLSFLLTDVLQTTENSFIDGTDKIHITLSIGASSFPQDCSDGKTLLNCATSAMMKAKLSESSSFSLYDQSLTKATVRRFLVEKALKKAIENEQLDVFYQPQVNSITTELIGFETLLRWNSPELGFVSPDEFINIAEKSGLMYDLGKLVLKSVISTVKEWELCDYVIPKISINVSPKELENPNYIQNISTLLQEYKIAPTNIMIEFTESESIDENHAMYIIDELQKLSISVALDDFGSGYTSYAYLRLKNIDLIKIDRTFIQHICSNPTDVKIVKGIVAIAKELNIKVLAEGCETNEQHQILIESDVDFIQGYYFGRPATKQEAEKMLIKKDNTNLS
jgi:diguanylate cyclase (GGDEF)-like protein